MEKENKKTIEIPFGAKDSELYKFEYTIPDGYEAEIKDGKVIVTKKESEDERIKKALIKQFSQQRSEMTFGDSGLTFSEIVAYLEKQKEQNPAEWKPLPESMEALLLAIEGEWDAIKPTGYMSRRLEDLYDGLVNTFDIDEKYLGNLPKTEYTEKDIKEIKALKKKIDSSMETKPAEWSEEDEKRLKSIIHRIEVQFACNIFGEGKLDVDWLNSLPERFNLEQKQEWSEEDEKNIEKLDGFLSAVFCYGHVYISQKDKEELQNWLKSLRPQPHWKPSEEQMKGNGVSE